MYKPGAGTVVKNHPALQEMQETQVHFLGLEDSLEKELATYSSILSWKIPWTEDPGGLQSMGLQSWTQLSTYTHMKCINLEK